MNFTKIKSPKPYEIAKNFDEKGVPFIALSLKLNAPIWTGDKEMIKYGLKSGKSKTLEKSDVTEEDVETLSEVIKEYAWKNSRKS